VHQREGSKTTRGVVKPTKRAKKKKGREGGKGEVPPRKERGHFGKRETETQEESDSWPSNTVRARRKFSSFLQGIWKRRRIDTPAERTETARRILAGEEERLAKKGAPISGPDLVVYLRKQKPQKKITRRRKKTGLKKKVITVPPRTENGQTPHPHNRNTGMVRKSKPRHTAKKKDSTKKESECHEGGTKVEDTR